MTQQIMIVMSRIVASEYPPHLGPLPRGGEDEILPRPLRERVGVRGLVAAKGCVLQRLT